MGPPRRPPPRVACHLEIPGFQYNQLYERKVRHGSIDHDNDVTATSDLSIAYAIRSNSQKMGCYGMILFSGLHMEHHRCSESGVEYHRT